jgi:hypothetical protein
MSTCEVVLDRLAAGEPLGPEEETHVASCVDCARLSRVPGLLASTAREPDPGPGFSTRMQVAARGRLAVRKRQRVALTAVAAVAVASAAFLAFSRPTHTVGQQPGAIRTAREWEPQPQPGPVAEHPKEGSDAQLVVDLVRVAHVDSSLRGEAHWKSITKTLEPYRALLSQHGARQGAPR